MKRLIIALICLPFISNATTLDLFKGSYELLQGSSECYQQFDIQSSGDGYYYVWGDEISLTTLVEKEVNAGKIGYKDKESTATTQTILNGANLIYEEKGRLIYFPYSFRMELTKSINGNLEVKLNSFHYNKFLWEKMDCSYQQY